MSLYAPLGWPLRNECKNALCIDYQRRVSQNIPAEFIEWLFLSALKIRYSGAKEINRDRQDEQD